jgi:hypothetical protein
MLHGLLCRAMHVQEDKKTLKTCARRQEKQALDRQS